MYQNCNLQLEINAINDTNATLPYQNATAEKKMQHLGSNATPFLSLMD
jgi:hypothetical protein